MNGPPRVSLRPPEQVMRLDRMGSMFQTRLSFMRALVRRMAAESWRFETPDLRWDSRGHGVAVYPVSTGERVYSLVAFSQDLPAEQRTDRVIATAWDATFSLVDGWPDEDDLSRLAVNTPRQEAGRFSSRELVLARANKSLRLFDHVVDRLAAGRQPEVEMLAGVGYLMRTTAVYGSGKFGCGDRDRIKDRPEFAGSFHVEMLAVYLIRQFTIDLANHVARAQGGERAVALSPEIGRYLGIGNATGLGMAPFLAGHPLLLHNWVLARETALARVRTLPALEDDQMDRLRDLVVKARIHVGEWKVDDQGQSRRIAALARDLDHLVGKLDESRLSGPDHIYRWGESHLSLEGQELLVSILLEPFGTLVDDLCSLMRADGPPAWQPGMRLDHLRRLIEEHFDWALGHPVQDRRFWYYSEEKLEPRLGNRCSDLDDEVHEMPLAIARDVARLHRALGEWPTDQTVGDLVRSMPEHRFAARRVQTVARYPYAEIRDNLLADDFRPIDMLRFKLALFGASKFDPKSDLWTRITMYQGAPLAAQLQSPGADDWLFPTRPEAAA